MDASVSASPDAAAEVENPPPAATTVAAGLIGWWPAFTLGAYGVVLSEQILALCVAATSVFLVLVLSRPRRIGRQPAWLALLIPSVPDAHRRRWRCRGAPRPGVTAGRSDGPSPAPVSPERRRSPTGS